MELQTKYISLDEFQTYFQIDLRAQIGSEEKALAFLKRIEDRLQVFVDSNFNRNIDAEYPVFSEYQKEHYKLALLEQSIYIFKNSDLSVDSGYDVDRGEVMNVDRLHKLSVAPNCIDHLRVCGIWNRHIRATHRTGFGWLR